MKRATIYVIVVISLLAVVIIHQDRTITQQRDQLIGAARFEQKMVEKYFEFLDRNTKCDVHEF